MPDISTEINAFRNAVYGEDVRGSMISLANKLNNLVSSSDLGKILAQQIYFVTPNSKFYTKVYTLNGDSYASLLIRWTGEIAHRNFENHGYIFPTANNLTVTTMLNKVGTSYRYEDEDGTIWIRIPDTNVLVYDGVDKNFSIVSRSIVDGIRYVPMIGNNNGRIIHGLFSSLIFTTLSENINGDSSSIALLKELMLINASHEANVVKGGLGSDGRNYNPYVDPYWFESLRTDNYIDIRNSTVWVNPDVNISFICVYDANKQYIYRFGQRSNDNTGYFTTNIIDYTYLSTKLSTNQLNNTYYIRIEVSKSGLYERNTFTNLVKILYTDTPEDDSSGDSSGDSSSDNSLYSLEKEECEVLNYQRTSNEAYSKSPLAFLWISDIHNEQQRAGNAFNLIKTWGSNLFDLCINTGDTTEITQVTNLNWYNTLTANSIVPTLAVVGNHDAWVPNQNGTLAPRLDTYNYITANVKTTVPSIVQPTNAATNGLNYYYYDKGNVRIIVLDQMYWDTDQKTWFTNVLSNSSNKLVICCMHNGFNANVCDLVDCNMSKSFIITSYLPAPAEAAECVKAYMDNGGTFICWLVGHAHGDGLMKTKSEYGNQFIVAAPSLTQRASTLQKSNVYTSKLYNCFTYVALNTYDGCIKFYRIGSNISVKGNHWRMMSLDYVNGELISCN